jgi:hypothetical protein
VWRCHNVLRQHVIPHALGTPRSLAKECRLAEAENGITDFFARRVHTDELCINARRRALKAPLEGQQPPALQQQWAFPEQPAALRLTRRERAQNHQILLSKATIRPR